MTLPERYVELQLLRFRSLRRRLRKEVIGSLYIISTLQVSFGTLARFVGRGGHIVVQCLKNGWRFAYKLPFWKRLAPAQASIVVVQTDFPLETLEKVVSAAGRSLVVAVGCTSVASFETERLARVQMDRRIRISLLTPFIWSL